MFDEDVSLGKAKDLSPPPQPEKKNDDMDILDGPSVPESERDIVDDPMEPMDPLDPPRVEISKYYLLEVLFVFSGLFCLLV